MDIKNMKRSELTEQIRLFDWARKNEDFVPELRLLHHVPNEGKRSNGAVMKAAGLKAGVPDVCLPVAKQGYHGLYIEMKYGKRKETKEQKEFMEKLREQGYRTAIARSAEEAREIIRNYLSRAEGFDLVNCEEAAKIKDKCCGVTMDWVPCKMCEFYSHERID